MTADSCAMPEIGHTSLVYWYLKNPRAGITRLGIRSHPTITNGAQLKVAELHGPRRPVCLHLPSCRVWTARPQPQSNQAAVHGAKNRRGTSLHANYRLSVTGDQPCRAPSSKRKRSQFRGLRTVTQTGVELSAPPWLARRQD